MKRLIKIGYILILVAFLHNLILPMAASGTETGHWTEDGAATTNTTATTKFGDWEHFYHEPFTSYNTTYFKTSFNKEVHNASFRGLNLRIVGPRTSFGRESMIDEQTIVMDHNLFIIGGSELMPPSLDINFKEGLGGFSFEYKNLTNSSNNIIIDVKDGQKDIASETITLGEKGKVEYQRFDFNAAKWDEEGNQRVITLTLTVESPGEVAIDNIKWSNHNIKVEYLDGYGENDVLYYEYVRYGRILTPPGNTERVEGEVPYPNYRPEEDDALKRGYDFLGWYDGPNFEEAELFDFTKPILESTKIYSDWKIKTYIINYELNDGYFEPYEHRDQMVEGFLSDYFEFLEEKDAFKEGTHFYNWLVDEGFLKPGEEINYENFKNGTNDRRPNPGSPIEAGTYLGLYAKGFAPVGYTPGDVCTINFNLNGGVFLPIGGSSYSADGTGRNKMRNDFLTDFYNFLIEANTINTSQFAKASDFIHGKNKTTGFDGKYDEYINNMIPAIYDSDPLKIENSKNVNPALTHIFISQPEYNKWVPLIDKIDQYVTVVNPVQRFWGSPYTGSLRIKNYMKILGSEPAKDKAREIPEDIKVGGTPLEIPVEYTVDKENEIIKLPTPTKRGRNFEGWFLYNDTTKEFVGPYTGNVNAKTNSFKGNLVFYAKFKNEALPKVAAEEIYYYLLEDSFFRYLYDFDVEQMDDSNYMPDKDWSLNSEFFINQPEYNKWVPLFDLIDEYIRYGNPKQHHGLWKSWHLGAIRMEAFFNQHNPWSGLTGHERYVIYEMLRRVPTNIPKGRIEYTYTIEDTGVDFEILDPMKLNAKSLGWYFDDEFTEKVDTKVVDGKNVTYLKEGTVGSFTIYAKYEQTHYDIEYDLDGGVFPIYDDRDEMITDFLTDFHTFLSNHPIFNGSQQFKYKDKLTEFMHGINETSGFDGPYVDYMYFDSKTNLDKMQLMFDTGNTSTIDPASDKFINQPEYHDRWMPLLKLAATFTNQVNSSDDFWNDPELASRRLKELFRKTRPTGASSGITTFFNQIPDIPKEVIPYSYEHGVGTDLPTIVDPNNKRRFAGWYTDEEFKSPISVITSDDTGHRKLYARFYQSAYEVTYDFGDFGYYGTTKNEFIRELLNAYIDKIGLSDNITEETLLIDFFNNSNFDEHDDHNINKFINDGNWEWIKRFFNHVSKEQTDYTPIKVDGSDEFVTDQIVWRLNIHAFINSTKVVYEIKDSEGVITETYTSLDFSTLNNSEGFWSLTNYNTYKAEFISEGDLFKESDIYCWHPGYDFVGWADKDGNILTKLPKVVEGTTDITLTAQWTENDSFGKVIITFVDYDDTIIETIETDEGTDLTPLAPDAPVREHYEFIGWDKDITNVTESMVVKALYEGLTYILEFDTADDGTLIPPQQLVYPNNPTRPEEDPERPGFTFAGWFSDNECTEEFFFSRPLYEDTTAYAKWNPITYQIEYVLDGGEFINELLNPKTYTRLDEVELGGAVKLNHDFIGWYKDLSDEESKVEVIDHRLCGNLILYANYEIYKYIVSFDVNGGKEEIASVAVDHGSTVGKPTDPTRDLGYEFAGWYLNDYAYNFDTPITNNITLVAKWERSTYIVTYYKYEEGHPNNVEAFKHDSVEHGSFIAPPQVPHKYNDNSDGYLRSWSEDLSNKPIFKDYNIYPLYTPIEYNITYHLDGGVNDNDNPSAYNRDKTITLKDASKDGYTFVGWYLDLEDESTKLEVIEDRFGNLEIYAKYSLKTYNITYIYVDKQKEEHILNVSNHKNLEEYTIESRIILNDAEIDGFIFNGWYLDNDFNNKIEVIENKFGDLTIYANVTAIVYNITYRNINGTTHSNPDSYTREDTPIELLDPTERVGFNFGGWYIDSNFTSKTTGISSGATGDRTFYAKWNPIMLTVTFKDDNDNVIETQSVQYGHYAKEPENVTVKPHYDHVGWTLNNNDFDLLKTAITDHISLIAKYVGKTYVLTFETFGGTTISSQELEYPTKPTKPNDPDRLGYKFINWYKDSSFNTVFSFDEPLTNHTTAYAKWELETYTITYILKDGESHSNDREYTIESRIILTDAEKEGYLFEGWYENLADESSKVEVINGRTGDLTLYAKFSELIQYDILYVLYLKEPNDPIEFNPTKQTYTFNDETFSLETPINRESAKFVGWYDNPNFDGDVVTEIKKGSKGLRVFYAKWETRVHTVRFYKDSNFAEPALETIEGILHSSIITTFPKIEDYGEIIVPFGKEFIGWHYLDSSNDPVLFEEDQQVNKDFKLYPEFGRTKHAVNFYVEGLRYKKVEVYHNFTINPLPENPEITNKAFSHWALLNGDTFDESTIVEKDLDVFARWIGEEDYVYVIFDYNNNEQPRVDYIKKNTSITELPINPTLEGYSFVGWLHNGLIVDDLAAKLTTIKENMIFTAKYNIKTYTVTFYYEEDGEAIEASQEVEHGSFAIPPTAELEGRTFIGWDKPYINITEDTNIFAIWEENIYDVIFIDSDGTVLKKEKVIHGENATPPVLENVDGYDITWDKKYTNVTSYLIVQAIYTPKIFTVTYVSNNQVEKTIENIPYNTYIIPEEIPEVPKVPGKTGRWSIDLLGVLIKKDYQVEALYDVEEYNVIYLFKGGVEVDGGHYPLKYKITDTKTLGEAYLLGYKFLGWFINGNGNPVENLNGLTGDLILEAKYEIEEYTITYLNLENSTNTNVDTYTINRPVTLVDLTNVPDDKSFIGWFIDDEQVFIISGTGNKTVKALWETHTYTVEFYDYDGTLLKTDTVEHGKSATAPDNPTRDYYDFDRWSLDFETITADLDIYAEYKGKEYTITFDSVGGSDVSSETVTYPAIPQPQTTTKTGYIFAGWYLNDEKYLFDSPLTDNITVKAKWINDELTVKFVVGDTFTLVNVNYGSKVTQIADPILEGHNFTGWYLDGALFDFETLITESITLSANFEVIKIKITYKNKGVIEYSEYHDYGTIFTSVPTIPIKDGYNVVWSEDLTNYTVTEEKNIEAEYTPKEYTITYSNQLVGGGVNFNPVKYTIETETITLTNLEDKPEGNIFSGWYTKATGGEKVTEIKRGSFGNKIFYAQWILKDYDIDYILNGGTFIGYSISQRDLMIEEFLSDFYNWLKDKGHFKSEVSESDFIHGAGKTSGFDGMYNEEDYFTHMYYPGVKSVVEGSTKFVNTSEYNHWIPLLELINDYTGINEDQIDEFWTSPLWVGRVRIKPFILKENLWKNDNVQSQVDEITNKIPDAYIRESIYETYNLESPNIVLPKPFRPNFEFEGWYTTSNFSGSKVTTISKGSTGDKTFYAKWSEATYSITYQLNGGKFEGYTTKEEMVDGFFQDLYDFVKPSENLTTFKHGAGKTSGFNGTWFTNEQYKAKIYGANIESGNNAFFLSHSVYGPKWKPFADMMVEFVKINPAQSFWPSPFTGITRMQQYFQEVLPSAAWTQANLKMMPKTPIMITPKYTYKEADRDIILPNPTRRDYKFEGWYTTSNFSGSKVTKISSGSKEDKTFYAKWSVVVLSPIEIKHMTNSDCYAANVTRTSTKGVIIISPSSADIDADGWYSRWNRKGEVTAFHYIVDHTKIMETLPIHLRGWHTAGTGAASGNNHYVAIVMSEMSGNNFNKVWENAVDAAVQVLRHYKITAINKLTVVGRNEAHLIGLTTTSVASPQAYFDAHGNGKTMDDFRAAVLAKM